LIAAPYRKTLEEQDLDFDALLPSSLTALERAIITALFRDNKTMLEIGSAFGFSESRISQIFADVMPRIRVSYFARFRKDGEDSDG
jgi:DNA-directed RNA polymerase specialized sigma subunit